MSRQTGSVIGSRLAVAVTTAIITTVVVAGGIALANVPNNSVGSVKIVNESIRSEDIRNGAIKSVDIGTGAVTPADVSPALKPYMARVNYSAGIPTITSQRGGLVFVNEPFTGAVRIGFPRNMDSCAVTATSTSGGVDTAVRRSTTGTGNEVVVVSFDTGGVTVEQAFDLIAQC